MPVWGLLIERAAAANATTPAEALTRLARSSTDKTLLHNLAVNPASTEETLAALVSPPVRSHLSADTWAAVATHPECTDEIARIATQHTVERAT